MVVFLIRILIVLFAVNLTSGQQLEVIAAKHPVNNPDVEIPVLLNAVGRMTDISQRAEMEYCIALRYGYLNMEEAALDYYLRAKNNFNEAGKEELSKQICLDIHKLISSQNNYGDYGIEFLEEFHSYAFKKNTPYLLARCANEYGKIMIDSSEKVTKRAGHYLKKAELLFKEGLQYASDAGDLPMKASIYSNLGVVKKNQKQYDAARKLYAASIALNRPGIDNNEIFANFRNLGNTFYAQEDFKMALRFYYIAEGITLPKYKSKSLVGLYRKMMQSYHYMDVCSPKHNEYFNLRDKYMYLYEQLGSDIKEESQNRTIAYLKTKYEATKKEADNIALQNKNLLLQNKQKLTLVLLITASALILLASLWIKNLRRKKKIAEQEHLIQVQKTESILREQELHEIDVMLETQDKERQRVANELHDNLGSILATLKLNFQNLEQRNTATPEPDGLYEKTDALLEEAYSKVRHIAHLKHLGVIGSEGLLVSVRKMAGQMSIPGQFTVNVIPFGLDERLENSIEVFLFRSIQELCTNVIKYAKATELNIYLTQHGPSDINIMVEDNGIGFDPAGITSAGGIGLRNIEKKTEQLDGTFTVDSIRHKGTTIIINLPL